LPCWKHKTEGKFENKNYKIMEDNYSTFRERLNNNHIWPSLYMFKFIVPKGKEMEISKLFPKNEVETKESSSGNYISLTTKVMISSSDEVIRIYEEAQKVEGVIAL
jgi:uncharacterized protein